MKPEYYNSIKHWKLSTQLVEIQDRAESARILAQAVSDGHTNDSKRDLDQLTKSLAELADWIGFVQRQHAPMTADESMSKQLLGLLPNNEGQPRPPNSGNLST